jgi:hypothetical protein
VIKFSQEDEGVGVRRPVKINFEALSLEETARQLGIPKKRAQRILSFVGADDASDAKVRSSGKRRTSRRHKAARKPSR